MGALVLALLVAALWLRESLRRVEAAHPIRAGRLEVADLRRPLTVFRDRWAVPHVEAADELDAWFGLGFVHAQDRPVQLEWLRRTARGRLAEVLGPEALPGDRRARILGLARHAEADLPGLPRAARRVLEAYAAGVNARWQRLERGARGLPPELRDWGGAPEPWQPADSLAVLKLFAWGLEGALDESLVLSDLVEQLGPTVARFFFPSEAPLDPLSDAPMNARVGLLPRGEGLRAASGTRSEPAPRVAPLRRALGLHGASVGSSAWAVHGTHARSSRPLLAADAHFEPTVPGTYYAAHLRGGPLEVAGATLPGVPVFWTGTNGWLAWASVSAGLVVSDLYVEHLQKKGSGRYHDGRRWRPLQIREEEIRVRGAEPEVLTVRETGHGPLVNDLLQQGREPLALRWAGATRGLAVTGLLGVAHARSGEGLRRALRDHHEPVLSVVYAERDGEIGLQVAGYVPLRSATGLVPVPARAPDQGWRGRVPPQQLPSRVIREGGGFVVAADGPLPVVEDGPPLEALWRPGERSERIAALLTEAGRRGGLGPRGLHGMQVDVVAPRAGRLVERALALAGDPGELDAEAAEVVEILSHWDRSSDAHSQGAAVYHVLLDQLLERLLTPVMGEALLRRYVALGRVNPTALVLRILQDPERSPARQDEETLARMVRSALRETWLRLSVELGVSREKWTWGRLHPLRFRPLWPSGWSATRSAPGPFAYAGDGSSIQAAEYRPLESFEARVASTWRFAIDTAALDEALVGLAPGQSEHPAHADRESGLERWLAGRPTLLVTSRLAVEEGAVARLDLEPAP